jgi:hypothetical protein
MSRILFSVLPALLFVFSSCGGSADKKVPELASEMCKCFESMQKELSPVAQAFYKDVAKAAKPSAAFQNGLDNMDSVEAEAIRAGLLNIDEKDSKVNQCMEAYERKYEKETTRDEDGLVRKVLEEMRKNNACPLGAAIVNLGIEGQKQGK